MKKATFVLSLIVVLCLLVPAAGAQTRPGALTKTLSDATPGVGETFTVTLTVTTDVNSIGETLHIVDVNPNPAALQIVPGSLTAAMSIDGSGNFVWEDVIQPLSVPNFTISYQMQVVAYGGGTLDGPATLTYEPSGLLIDVAHAPFAIAQTIPAGGSASFPTATNAPGVDITTDTAVSVAVGQTEGTMCTTNLQDGAVLHCYDITVEPAGTCLTVTFNYAAGEANGNTAPQIWHWNGAGWDQIVPTASAAGSVTAYICDFSPFALADVMPTAITLETFAASGSAPLALLAVAVVALTVLGLALRRRSA